MNIGKYVVKYRFLIIGFYILCIFPFIYFFSQVNIVKTFSSFLPEGLDSAKAQKIQEDYFKTSGSAFIFMVNDTDERKKKLNNISKEILKFEAVKNVLDPSQVGVLSIPKKMLPQDVRNQFYSEKGMLTFIQFKYSAEDKRTFEAIYKIQNLLKNEEGFLLGGTAAINAESETGVANKDAFFLLISVIGIIIVLILITKSLIIPFLFIFTIAVSYIINMGTNQFLPGISNITMGLAGALQLGVSIDYCIFLYHRLEEELKNGKDLHTTIENTVNHTASSILTSSLTTVIGFFAITFMTLRLGLDLGSVLAKGVLFSLIATLTFLPAMIIVLYPKIQKYKLKINLKFKKININNFFEKYRNKKFRKNVLILFIILAIIATYTFINIPTSYQISDASPENLVSLQETNKISELAKLSDVLTVLLNIGDFYTDDFDRKKYIDFREEVLSLEGIPDILDIFTINTNKTLPKSYYEEINSFYSKPWLQLTLKINLTVGSEKYNKMYEELLTILNKYYPDNQVYISGQGSIITDFINIASKDFSKINIISLALVFLVLAIALFSLSVPLILMMIIQFAIFLNYTTELAVVPHVSFITKLIIGSIQLGATVDYAVLFTNRFSEKYRTGASKIDSVIFSLKNTFSPIMSASLCLFIATLSYSFGATVPIIRAVSRMIGRGALISFVTIIVFLPIFIYIFADLFKKSDLRKNKLLSTLKLKK